MPAAPLVGTARPLHSRCAGLGAVAQPLRNESNASAVVTSGMRGQEPGEIVRIALAVVWRMQDAIDVEELLGVSGFGQFWVREIGVKKLLV